MLFGICFAFLLEHVGDFFERAERRRRDEYLAVARDLIELENLMRSIDRDGYPRS